MKGDGKAFPFFIDLAFVCMLSAFISFGSCQSPSNDAFLDSVNQTTDAMSASVIAGIVVSVLVVVIAGVAVFYCLNWHLSLPHIGSHDQPSDSDMSSLPIEVKDHLKRLQFTYAEVLGITNNLRVKLGQGGFGPVYYGKLKDGLPVAVKRLSSTSHQGTQEFLNEVEILSRSHHKNLVSLVGYCCEVNERCLIYEFMPNGTLDDRLHGLPSEQEPLKWLTRLKIAVGAAKGFNYLHNDCAPAIIHRDVKCSNTLLDEKLDAKVADFGLSKLLSQPALTHITTGVKGTFGFLDPEYAQTQRLTEKSDVYSFGVILLELLTGNKAIMQHDEMGDIMEKETVEVVANIALQCIASRGTERPHFEDILQVLEGALKLEFSQQAHLPSAATDVSIDIQTVAHTIVPIVGGPNNRNEPVAAPHKTV